MLLIAGMTIDGTLLIVTYAQEVLGYSAVQFGLMTAVLTVMSVIGAYAAQAVVTRTNRDWSGWPEWFWLLCLSAAHPGVGGRKLLRGHLPRAAGLGDRARRRLRRVANRRACRRRREESGLAAGLVDSSFNIGVHSGSRSSRPLPCHAPTTR